MSYLIPAILLAYLIGSISSAIIVCKIMKLPDPRKKGSRNPGASNVLRIGGKKAAFITLLGDSLKGFLPVFIAYQLGFNATAMAAIALAAFLGHLFPIYFRFEGGKGVATLIGSLLALNWPTGLCWLATWIIMAYFFRYSSLAGMTASLLAPIYMWFFSNNIAFTFVTMIMAVILIIRHIKNIRNLLKGEEKHIDDRTFNN